MGETNYEHYQEKIIEIFKSGNKPAIVDNKPVHCEEIECDFCESHSSASCTRYFGEWLEEEYKPQDLEEVEND